MAGSDRSRSPAPVRNRTEPRGQVHAPRPELPFFPRWPGPMNSSILHFQNMPRPQSRPQWAMNQPGPFMMGRMMNPSQSMMQTNWSNHQFPPTRPPSIPPTLPYLPHPRLATPPCSPTVPCPPTQPCSPGTPSVPSSQPRLNETPPSTSPRGPGHNEATRVYGFDLNPHWQEDRNHYDNQKINGVTFPRTIRQSAFTQKLDIEGCDPLALPLAALLYQQANNFWLRKLAHGREVYLIPTGDISAVVFTTELLTQLRSRGIDLDRVSHSRARQDGKLLDKTNNTKYAAQQIADIIHSWLPARTTDPDSQHEINQLRNQLAELRQRAGEDPGDTSTPPRTGPSASSPANTPIQRALMNNSTGPTPPPTPAFDPSSLLVCSSAVNPWLTQHMPTTLAVRAFTKWLKELPLSEPKRKVLTENIAKTETRKPLKLWKAWLS